MSMWTLRIAPILAAVVVSGCVARAGAPVSFPGAATPADVGDRPAENGPAVAVADRPAEPTPAAGAARRAPNEMPPRGRPRPTGTAGSTTVDATGHRGDPDLSRRLDQLFTASDIGPVVWGVDVRALDRNQRLYARDPDILLTPASTMKLVTLAATAERLGWDDRFETALLTAAPIRDGVLLGDLVVRGAGDPTINASGGNIFAAWAGEMRRLGVRRIAGRIVGDDDVLDDGALETPGFGSGWAWDDLSRGFAAPAGALQHRENVVEVVVEPGRSAGRPASARFRHSGSGLTLRNDVVTVRADQAAGIRLRRTPGRSSLVATGRIPEGASPIVRTAAVGNPTLFFVEAFKRALEQDGIGVEGEAVDVDSLATRDKAPTLLGLRPLVRHRSEPLSTIGVDMLKQSKNLYAESLVRHLGVVAGSAAHAGRSVVSKVLADWGIDRRGAVIAGRIGPVALYLPDGGYARGGAVAALPGSGPPREDHGGVARRRPGRNPARAAGRHGGRGDRPRQDRLDEPGSRIGWLRRNRRRRAAGLRDPGQQLQRARGRGDARHRRGGRRARVVLAPVVIPAIQLTWSQISEGPAGRRDPPRRSPGHAAGNCRSGGTERRPAPGRSNCV